MGRHELSDVVERSKQGSLELLGLDPGLVHVLGIERRDDEGEEVLLAAVADANAFRKHGSEPAPEPRVARHVAGREHEISSTAALGVRRVAEEGVQRPVGLHGGDLQSEQVAIDACRTKGELDQSTIEFTTPESSVTLSRQSGHRELFVAIHGGDEQFIRLFRAKSLGIHRHLCKPLLHFAGYRPNGLGSALNEHSGVSALVCGYCSPPKAKPRELDAHLNKCIWEETKRLEDELAVFFVPGHTRSKGLASGSHFRHCTWNDFSRYVLWDSPAKRFWRRQKLFLSAFDEGLISADPVEISFSKPSIHRLQHGGISVGVLHVRPDLPCHQQKL